MGTARPRDDCLHDGLWRPPASDRPGCHLHLVWGPEGRRPQPGGRPCRANSVLAAAGFLRAVPGLVGTRRRNRVIAKRGVAPGAAALLVADGRNVSRAGTAPG